MKYRYDPKTDILLIELSRGKPDFGEQKGNIITHYNKRGTPIEIEILDASKAISDILEVVLNKKKEKAYAYN
jgi:uncharacterized protein YuzE